MLILVRQGEKYGPEYPQYLRKMAKETSGLDTLVLGDGPDADLPLVFNWPGWWAKMELFRPDLPRPFIYVDLDSLILKDISHLLTMKGRWIAKEWHPNLKGCGKYQSSCMVIEENPADIWEDWISDPHRWMSEFHGDQNFLERFTWQLFDRYLPDTIGSYKIHSRDKPRHRIVTFHGKPKPPQIEDGWVKDTWTNLANSH